MVYVIISIAILLVVGVYFGTKKIKPNAQISDVKDSQINISGDVDVTISDVKNSKINIK